MIQYQCTCTHETGTDGIAPPTHLRSFPNAQYSLYKPLREIWDYCPRRTRLEFGWVAVDIHANVRDMGREKIAQPHVSIFILPGLEGSASETGDGNDTALPSVFCLAIHSLDRALHSDQGRKLQGKRTRLSHCCQTRYLAV
jgi:hypothetical protein